jgi:hypothetical protein
MTLKTKIVLWLLIALALVGVLGIVWFIKSEFFTETTSAMVNYLVMR